MAKKDTEAMRRAFEDALESNPEDIATHRAYADWLVEQGDPRGEFIQVQLALEQAPTDELRERENALLEAHRAEWLGDLADFFPVLETESLIDNFVSFRRGWIDQVQIFSIRAGIAGELARAPQLRLLRRLAVVNPDAPEMDLGQAFQTHVMAGVAWFDEDEDEAMVPLLECPYLGNLREFQLGDADHERCDAGDGPVLGLLQKMPKLEELRLFLWRMEDAEAIFSLPMPHLRLLHVGGVFDYPLEALAANESLGNLTDLLIQPAAPDGHSKLWPDGVDALIRSPHLTGLRSLALRFLLSGDAACAAVAESGILERLTALDLQYSDITDEGAAQLAGPKGLGNLVVLELRGNRITEEGIAQLQGTGVPLAFDPQLGPEEDSGGDSEESDES